MARALTPNSFTSSVMPYTLFGQPKVPHAIHRTARAAS
jgi:hypothetical protein